MSNILSKEQLRILKEMDVDASLKYVADRGFIPMSREVATAGLHKARLLQKHLFTTEELKISRDWLRANNYKVPK